ncbi:MAG TPA: FecR domain-containing protein, partial [Pseudidiomarina sp.]|nr:FecR domain-containing protein [Pseudidiomarina sp.]
MLTNALKSAFAWIGLRTLSVVLVILAAAGFSPLLSAAETVEIARLLFVHGQVEIHREAEVITAQRGNVLYVGDRVVTQENSTAQLRFNDQQLVAIRPKSAYEIVAHTFDPDNVSENTHSSHLLRGGLRAVTGLIGKSTPENVEFTTPVATMGIRGTDLRIVVIPVGQEDQYGGLPAGVYLLVNDGLVNIKTLVADEDVPAGGYKYAEDENSPPSDPPVDSNEVFGEPDEFVDDDEEESEESADENTNDSEENDDTDDGADDQEGIENDNDLEPVDPDGGSDSSTGGDPDGNNDPVVPPEQAGQDDAEDRGEEVAEPEPEPEP